MPHASPVSIRHIAVALAIAAAMLAAPADPACAQDRWEPVFATRPPSARAAAATALDTRRERMLVFGGTPSHQDVWELALGEILWRELHPDGVAPGPRVGASAIYDAAEDRVLWFGGFEGGVAHNEVHVLSFASGAAGTWSLLQVQGAPPSPRGWASAAFDPEGRRMLVFGGEDGGFAAFAEVWELSLDGAPTWRQIATGNSIPARGRAAMVFDPASRALVVFGGRSSAGALSDTWRLDLATAQWTPLATGSPPRLATVGAAGVVDPIRHDFVVYGGASPAGTSPNHYSGDVYLLDLDAPSGWARLDPEASFPRRALASAAFDATRDRLVIYGGNTSDGSLEVTSGDTYLIDFERIDSDTLSRLHEAPPARTAASAVFDSAGARVLVFGGVNSEGGRTASLDVLHLDGEVGWEPVAVGLTPPVRSGHGAIWDERRGQMVVFGGESSDGNYLGDVRVFGFGTGWSSVSISGAVPLNRARHGMVADRKRDRFILFGGQGASVMNDLWEFRLDTRRWTRLSFLGAPPTPRWSCVMAYDPTRDCVWIAGGRNASGALEDVWALDLTVNPPRWKEILPDGIAPGARWAAAGAYDPAHDRLLLFGGAAGSVTLADTWALDLADTTWRELAPEGDSLPTRRAFAASAFDVTGGRLVVWGGADSGPLSEAWLLGSAAAARARRLPQMDASILEAATPRYALRGDAATISPSTRAEATAPDGEWSNLLGSSLPSGRSLAAGAFDSRRRRFVTFGGANAGADTWVMALDGVPIWTELVTTGDAPAPRQGASAVYDSTADRLLLFGGASGGIVTHDLYQLSLETLQWSRLEMVDGPAARTRHTAVFDARRLRMLVFGGATEAGPVADVWELALAGTPRWRALETAGAIPARERHVAIYDPVHDAMLVAAGQSSSEGFGDVWRLDCAVDPPRWSALAARMAPRSAATAVLDARRRDFVLFGGEVLGGAGPLGPTNEILLLDLDHPSGWARLDLARTYVQHDHIAVADAVSDRVMSFGGGITGAFADQRILDLSVPQWNDTLQTPVAPDAVSEASMVYDSPERRVIVYGGTLADRFRITGNTYMLDLGSSNQWSALPAGPAVSGHRAIWDPIRHRMLVVGGLGGSYIEVWQFTFSSGWRVLTVTGARPPQRSRHGLIYDRRRDRLVLYGGRSTNFLTDLWELRLGVGLPRWRTVPVAGQGPNALYGFSMVLDPERDRAILYGGRNGASTFMSDAWALSFAGDTARWAALAPVTMAPEPRWLHGAIVDEPNDRMVVSGGENFSGSLDDLWEFSLGDQEWRQLSPAGAGPAPRGGAGLVALPELGRAVLFGGNRVDPPTTFADTWVLSWGPGTGVLASLIESHVAPDVVSITWHVPDADRVAATVQRRDPTGAWIELPGLTVVGRDRLRIDDPAVAPSTRYVYRLTLVVEGVAAHFDAAIETPARRATFELRGVNPNPGRGAGVVEFALPDAAAARLETLDLMGRRLGAIDVGALGAGVHRVPVPLDRPVAPGIVLVRLIRAGVQRTSRWVVVR